MNRSAGPTATLWLLTCLLMTGCLPPSCEYKPTPPAPDAGPACAPGSGAENCRCSAKSECAMASPGLKWSCTPAHTCVQVCAQEADCEGSGLTCVDLQCLPRACGDDSECTGGQRCIDSSCQAAPTAVDVTSCVVLPAHAVLNAGGSAQFEILTRKSGQMVAYDGPVSWSATDVAATTTSTGITATFAAASDAPAGTGSIGASIGSVTCTPATLKAYAAAGDELRVVVVSSGTSTTAIEGAPIPSATVVVDDEPPVLTSADGVASFPDIAMGAHTVSVFAEDFDWVTVVGTSARDLLIPVHPRPVRAVFSGQFKDTDFGNLGDPSGTTHFALSGSSFPGNLMDMTPLRLLGPRTGPMEISLGTGTPYGPFDNPEGVAVGLGAQMFGDEGGGHYAIEAEPGVRTFWRIGGNAVVGDLLKLVGPNVWGAGPVDEVTAVVSALVRLSYGMESGVETGVETTAGESSSLSVTEGNRPLGFGTRLRINTDIKVPMLPDGLQSVAVFGGVDAGRQGFVPLGVMMGLDYYDSVDGTERPDGLVDGEPSIKEQHVRLRLAPRHGGLENVPWVITTMALPAQHIFGTPDVLKMAGNISFHPHLLVASGTSTQLDLSRPFLGFPESPRVDTGRALSFAAPVSGASLHRLDIGPEESHWSVWFPAGRTAVLIPTPPAGFTDRLAPQMTASNPLLSLRSASLNGQPDAPLTWDGLWTFDGRDADTLTQAVDSFSVTPVESP